MNVAEIIQNDPAFAKSSRWYVSVYSKNQEYGGPEEGGWYFSRTKHEGAVSFPNLEAAEWYLAVASVQAERFQAEETERFQAEETARFRAEVEDDFVSGETCGEDKYFVVIEAVSGAMDNTEEPIPRWE